MVELPLFIRNKDLKKLLETGSIFQSFFNPFMGKYLNASLFPYFKCIL